MKTLSTLFACLLLAAQALAITLPPVPQDHFTDYAGLTDASVAKSLNAKLAKLEAETTTQFVVALFPTGSPDGLPAADYAQRIMQSWRVGQKGKDNGVALFIFLKDVDGKTATQLKTGYGVEGVLPDATCLAIVNQVRTHVRAAKAATTPAVKLREWNAAAMTGVDSVIAAVHGEFTAGASDLALAPGALASWLVVIFVCFILIVLLLAFGGRSWSAGSGGSWSSSSSGGSSSGGSFSGGGGSCGGGGAGGSD